MIHDIKSWPPSFNAIISRARASEIRKNDRQYAFGDTLRIREWIPEDKAYTGRVAVARVMHVQQNIPGLMPGYCLVDIFFEKMEIGNNSHATHP